MIRKPKRNLLFGITIGLPIVAIVAYRLFFPGIPFLLDYMKPSNFEGTYSVRERRIDADGRTVPLRIYTPSDKIPKGTILLVHGVHNDGYYEKRLIHFTTTLAHNGFRVVTPDIDDLKQYHIVERAVKDINAAALWLLNDSGLIGQTDKFALWGISFAGGLCLSLCATPRLRDRISSSFSFGGHGDLDRTMQYLMTGETQGEHLRPHVYGQAVLVRRFADRLVPAPQVFPLQQMIYEYLRGNYKIARQRSAQSQKESRTLFQLIFRRDVDTLGAILKSKVGKPVTAKALSAVKGPAPACAVFLLHGSSDNVIPRGELETLKEWAVQSEKSKVYALVSPVISHVELEENPSSQLMEYVRIIRFWNELLRNS